MPFLWFDNHKLILFILILIFFDENHCRSSVQRNTFKSGLIHLLITKKLKFTTFSYVTRYVESGGAVIFRRQWLALVQTLTNAPIIFIIFMNTASDKLFNEGASASIALLTELVNETQPTWSYRAQALIVCFVWVTSVAATLWRLRHTSSNLTATVHTDFQLYIMLSGKDWDSFISHCGIPSFFFSSTANLQICCDHLMRLLLLPTNQGHIQPHGATIWNNIGQGSQQSLAGKFRNWRSWCSAKVLQQGMVVVGSAKSR